VRRTSLTVLAFSMSLLPTMTFAGPKEDGRALVERWAETVNRGKVDEVAALFRRDAVVWGITTTSLATSADDVKGYFSNALSRPLTVKLQNHTTSALSDGVVVDAGMMELSRPAEGGGQPTVIPVRYHFVVVKDGPAWKIAALHASRRPQ
jgi:uncharacterized protein (TIGR02246 family)